MSDYPYGDRRAPNQITEETLAGRSTAALADIAEMGKQRFDFFIAFVLKYQLADFHVAMLSHQLKTPHSMILAPRGGGKSTICDVSYCLWRIVQNPNIRICIASKSGDQAKSFLGEIKQHIEMNQDFRALYGDLVGSKWNEDAIVVKTRTRILKEPTIMALGSGAGIPGFHFDLIIGDDLVDLDNSATKHQRDKSERWFYNVLSPTLEPEGEMRIIGTRYHPDDLYGKFAAKNKATGEYLNTQFGAYVFRVKALTTDETTGDKRSFWPAKFSVEWLEKKRHDSGMVNFNLQYQNDPTIAEGGIISIDDLEPFMWIAELQPGQVVLPHEMHLYRPPLSELAIFQGVDPAIGQKQENDFFAHATIGVSRNMHIFVLELLKLKISASKQVDLIVNKWHQWNPERVGIETIAYQQALAQLVKERGAWISVHETKPRNDKTQRARVLSTFIERHELHLRADMLDTMEVLVGMPFVEHDDDFDAIDIAVEAAKQQVLKSSVVGRLPSNFRRR